MQEALATDKTALRLRDSYEHSAHLAVIEASEFGAMLNEKIPPISGPVELPESHPFPLISEHTRKDRGHPDVRFTRRAETIARHTAVTHERGEGSDGLRRVLVIQMVKLTYISAVRLAEIEGRLELDPSAVSLKGLVGSVLHKRPDPHDENNSDVPDDDMSTLLGL